MKYNVEVSWKIYELYECRGCFIQFSDIYICLLRQVICRYTLHLLGNITNELHLVMRGNVFLYICFYKVHFKQWLFDRITS